MRASNFSDSQKAFILKKGDAGVPVAEVTSVKVVEIPV